MQSDIPLTELTMALKKYTGGATRPYRQLYHAVLDGALPAKKSSTGRWMIARADLAQIVTTLGLEKK